MIDFELSNKRIRAGDKVVMYICGNRDQEVIEDADAFIIDPRARICRSVLVSTFASAIVWPNYGCESWEEIIKRWQTYHGASNSYTGQIKFHSRLRAHKVAGIAWPQNASGWQTLLMVEIPA